jgi:NADH-quinone oxidoreductase subunit M
MLLGLLIFLPLAFSLLAFSMQESKMVKHIALGASLAELVLALGLLLTTDTSAMHFSSQFLQQLGFNFVLNVDGLGVMMILLTSLVTPLIIYSSYNSPTERRPSFYALVLLMEMALVGVFSAADVLLFYVFWELALLPIYFITAFLGGEGAKKITLKFFIYTLVGSLFMLVAILYIYVHTPDPHSFNFTSFYSVVLEQGAQSWVFLAFFLAFAIKIPIFPFHSWQPTTYNTAPTEGSMLLAGIMLKMGLYGIFRFILPLTPIALQHNGIYAIVLAVIGVIYGSVIAIKQSNIKKMIAFSSMAHVGLIAAAIFTRTENGMQGAILQMLSHGINVVGLFFCYEIIVRRTGTDEIASLGGIASKAPRFAIFFMIVMLGSVALPLTNSFIGEFLMLMGLFEYNVWICAVAGLSIILGAVYMLWMYQRVMFGETKPATEGFTDLTCQEVIVLTPVVVMIFWIGIFPNLFLETTAPVVKSFLEISSQLPTLMSH